MNRRGAGRLHPRVLGDPGAGNVQRAAGGMNGPGKAGFAGTAIAQFFQCT